MLINIISFILFFVNTFLKSEYSFLLFQIPSLWGQIGFCVGFCS